MARSNMTMNGYRELIAALGMTQTQAADFLGIGWRQSSTYATRGKIPAPTAKLLRLMAALRLSPAQVDALIGHRGPTGTVTDAPHLRS